MFATRLRRKLFLVLLGDDNYGKSLTIIAFVAAGDEDGKE